MGIRIRGKRPGIGRLVIYRVNLSPLNSMKKTSASPSSAKSPEPIIPEQFEKLALHFAIAHLHTAHQQARFADAPRLVIAIGRALKSADGARRHKDGLIARAKARHDSHR